jgi:DNA-binding FadR family transcriptional regulator
VGRYDRHVNAPERLGPDAPRRRVAVFGPLGADNPVDLIVQRIRATIAAGILEQGDLLPSEPEMAEQFGVAVFSIREALSQLRDEGLIVTRRGRYGGSTVQLPDQAHEILDERMRDISTAELRDIGDWRRMLITEEAALAAARASTRNATRLSNYVERLAESTSIAATASGIGRVHMELAAAAQSPRMSSAEIAFHAQHGWLIAAGLEDEDSRRATVEDLAAIVRAVEGRNEPRARSSAEIYATRLTHSIQERRLKAVQNA